MWSHNAFGMPEGNEAAFPVSKKEGHIKLIASQPEKPLQIIIFVSINSMRILRVRIFLVYYNADSHALFARDQFVTCPLYGKNWIRR